VEWVTPGEMTQHTIMTHIFFAHFMFNTFNVIVFLPLIRALETIVVKMLPVTEAELAQMPVVLEKHLLDTPVIALEQAKREIVRMAKMAQEAIRKCLSGILTDDRKILESVRNLEDVIDMMQLEITSYLTALSQRNLSDQVSIELPVLLHTVNDLERIGDHAINVVEIAGRKMDQKITWSDSALAEADVLRKEIDEMCSRIITALEDNDIKAAHAALQNERHLNRMQIEFRRSHVERMGNGICTPHAGLIFIDLVDNIEKTGDHLTNIAQAIIGGLQWEGIKPKIPAEA
jgi:phosphate:Na+ symporter